MGTLIETALASVGVTPDRVARWLGRESCGGCAERKRKLDALSAWAARVVQGKIDRAAQFLFSMIADE